MSNSRYIASIMNRHFITNDSYFFTFRNTVLGTYNEESKIFTDIYGNEYYYMMSSNALNMDIPYAAYHVMKIDELQKHSTSKDKELNEIISEYANKIEKKAYFVGYTKDYVPFLEVINLDKIREDANKQYNNDTEQENPILAKLENLILDTVDGKFSKEQLIIMKSTLEDIKDTIENAIGTMDTKIGAIESNKTFKDYLNEQLENPIDVIKPVPTNNNQKLLPPKTPSVKDYVVKKAKEKPKTEDTTIVMKPKLSNRIDIDDVYKKVTKTVIAQDEPVRRVIVELARKEMNPLKKGEAILLIGSTGVGKTELMRSLRENLNRKLYIVDTTQITAAGYTGADLSEILWDVYTYCGCNVEETEKAIIYFDEIDKKGTKDNGDVGGRGVLNSLLPFIEGTTYSAALDSRSSTKIVKINTTNMTVILGGAFSDVRRNLVERNKIGFDKEMTSLSDPKHRDMKTEDIVKYGMMPDEFMGRVLIIPLNELNKNDLKSILLESNKSALKKQEQIFRDLGVKLTYTSEYIDKVVNQAYSLKTGARALNEIVDNSTWKAFDEVYTHADKYAGLLLTEETVENNSNYQLIKKRQIKK